MIKSLEVAAMILVSLMCLAVMLVVLILGPIVYIIGVIILCVFYYPYIWFKGWIEK